MAIFKAKDSVELLDLVADRLNKGLTEYESNHDLSGEMIQAQASRDGVPGKHEATKPRQGNDVDDEILESEILSTVEDPADEAARLREDMDHAILDIKLLKAESYTFNEEVAQLTNQIARIKWRKLKSLK